MHSVNPDDPLYWLKSGASNLLHIADSSLDGGLLTNNDAELMRHLRQETGALINELINAFGPIASAHPETARVWSFLINKLLTNALSIGLVTPASSESAKAAIAGNNARRAREAKTQTKERAARDRAFQNALPAGWEVRRDLWSLAGHMKTKIDKEMQCAGYEGITQQAIYQRLCKHRRGQNSNIN